MKCTGSEYWKQFPATCGPLIDLFIDVKIFYSTKFPSFYVAPVFTLSYGCVLDRSFDPRTWSGHKNTRKSQQYAKRVKTNIN